MLNIIFTILILQLTNTLFAIQTKRRHLAQLESAQNLIEGITKLNKKYEERLTAAVEIIEQSKRQIKNLAYKKRKY